MNNKNTAKLRIKVTQKNINEGIRDSGSSCPVARAIRDALNLEDGIWVDDEYICVDKKDKAAHYSSATGTPPIVRKFSATGTPPIVRKFIEQFDKGKKVEPFEFDLKLKYDIWEK